MVSYDLEKQPGRIFGHYGEEIWNIGLGLRGILKGIGYEDVSWIRLAQNRVQWAVLKF